MQTKTNPRDRSEGVGKKVKTKAAKRVVPVHSVFIQLGFLDYVERLRKQGRTRVWPGLVPGRDGYGQKISRWFGRWRKTWLTKQNLEEKKAFHSLRHTCDNALKQAGLLDVRLLELMGHSLGKDQTFGRYGKRSNPKMLQEAIGLLLLCRVSMASSDPPLSRPPPSRRRTFAPVTTPAHCTRG